MSIWKKSTDLDKARARAQATAIKQLGIEFIEVGEDYLKGRMPVDTRTHQPMGILHGGASILLAETLGSTASNFAADEGFVCVGQEINGNHLRPVSSGWVYGVARPVHLGRSTHVWSIEITNEQGKLVCISRLTMAVVAIDKFAK